MEYYEFINCITEAISRRLGNSVRVSVRQIWQNNMGPVDTVSIFTEKSNVSSALIIMPFFLMYRRGSSYEEVVDTMIQQWRTNCKEGMFALPVLSDFEQMKNTLTCRLVNYEQNKELLKNVPYISYLDLAIVACCSIPVSDDQHGWIMLRREHMCLWGLEEETVLNMAIQNTRGMFPYTLSSIETLLSEIEDEEFDMPKEDIGESGLYVLSNSECYYGAAQIIYTDILEQIMDRIGGEYYVLPSSIHECMIVPLNCASSLQDLKDMVKEVNRDHVAEHEILSNNVYRYRKGIGLSIE